MIEFKTPSGYLVYFKRDYLTFGEKRQLEKIIIKNSKIDTSTGKVDIENPLSLYDFQEQALKILIEKIVIDGKEYKENLLDIINNWKEIDGQAVFGKVNEFTSIQNVNNGEKK